MRIAIVDTETTGLLPQKHHVIEAALEIVDVTPQGITTVDAMDFRLRFVKQPTNYTPQALEVNGYNDGPGGDWEHAPFTGSAQATALWTNFVHKTAKLPLCAQNVPFDDGFLRSAVMQHGLRPAWGRRFVDIMSYSFLLSVEHDLEKFGLADVYDAMGGEKIAAHRATADVLRCRRILELMHKRFFSHRGSEVELATTQL